MVFGPLRRVKFLITAPFIVLMLFVINVMTSPGEWWVQWAAFGIGIAWVINLFKLIRDIVVIGGLAAFGAYIFNRNRQASVRLHQTATPGQAVPPGRDASQHRQQQVDRHRVVAAERNDDVRVALARLDELEVHRLDRGLVLIDHRLHGAAALGHVALQATDEARVRIGVDEHLDVHQIA